VESSSSFLFHHPKFIFRNPEDSIILFENHSAKIYFSRIGSSLISLDKAPFGSFIVDQQSTPNDLNSLIEKVLAWSKREGITTIVIRTFPEVYHPMPSTNIKTVLLESGFTEKYKDITQIVPIADESMNLNIHKKRRLRKAEALEFSFHELTLDFLEESYSLIVESRMHKGYPVTMSLRDLRDMFALFPTSYILFGVLDKNKLISASVSIKVNTEILYCFYIGDDLTYRAYSPVTALINGMYHYGKANHFKILDLGLSTDKGILNKGLYEFKKTFGSLDSAKLTFAKQL
jgi:hypothetical protein